MLSIAAGVFPEFDPPTIIDAAAAAGFDGVGIWFEPSSWTASTTAEVKLRLDATGLHPLDIEPVFVTAGGDDGERLIDVAGEIGAANVLTVSLGLAEEPFTERFAELCDHAAPAGVTVNVEFGRLFGVESLAGAQRVLAAIDRPNAGILMDNIHVDRAGHSNDDVAQVDPAAISYAQLCDAPPTLADDSREGLIADAMDLRCNLGDGGLPWQGFLNALPNDTPLSLEIRSAQLRTVYPDATDRAHAVFAATKAALAAE